MFDDFLVSLSERKLYVFVISGNHDSPERIAFASRLISGSGIHLSPVYKGKVEALNIAIAACGAKVSDVHDVEIDYDTSIRGVVYDVEFYYNKQKYEYKIGPDKSIIYSTNGIDD